MLNKEEQQKILAAFEKNMEDVKLTKSTEGEYPSGGSHTHDESNPLGIHSHFNGDADDGPHTHTPQNPGGEHAHGENAGMALIDGAHVHGGFFGSGYHWHENHDDDSSGEIPITDLGQSSE